MEENNRAGLFTVKNIDLSLLQEQWPEELGKCLGCCLAALRKMCDLLGDRVPLHGDGILIVLVEVGYLDGERSAGGSIAFGVGFNRQVTGRFKPFVVLLSASYGLFRYIAFVEGDR